MSVAPKTTRCTDCGSEFSDEELIGVSACPVCRTESFPHSIADDVTVKINWHELRILGIWASNWAARECPPHSKRTLKSILARLAAQMPREDMGPLTIVGELQKALESGVGTGAEIHHSDGNVEKVQKKS